MNATAIQTYLDTTPALAPPPGVQPNFVNPYSLASLDIGWSATCFGLATLGLLARLYTRAAIMKKVQWEDYALMVSWLGWVAFLVFAYYGSTKGGGRHQWDVTLGQLISFVWYSNTSIAIYLPAVYFARLSVVLQLQRIFSGSQKGFVFWAFYAIHAFNLVYYIVSFFITIFPCMPRARLTDPSIPGTCINFDATFIAGGVFGLVTDIATLALPLYAIRKLKMAHKQKWGVFAIFATGILACIASLLRTYYSVELYFTADMTFVYGPLGVVTSAEFACIMLIACFPVMPRLYQHIREKSGRRHSVGPYIRSTEPSMYSKRKSLRMGESFVPGAVYLRGLPDEVWLDLEEASYVGQRHVSDSMGSEGYKRSIKGGEATNKEVNADSRDSVVISPIEPTHHV